jgi:DNA-binding PadR family transcriptional regulator
MSTGPLTPVSYVVLGLVAAGATTSYEMKQRVAKSIGYFWSFPHSQLYAEPGRLVGLGLLTEEHEAGGRHRRLYALTDGGREALAAWLREPAREQTQIRDIGLLKLFLGADVASEEEVAALARAQEEAHRSRLAVYESIEPMLDGSSRRATTLRAGLLFERMFVGFWRELAESATPRSRSSPDSAADRR